MLHVLLTSLEEEAQKSHDSVASRAASLSFYDCIIGTRYMTSKRFVCTYFDRIRRVVSSNHNHQG